jgi:sn-glycerol 3-phosphate transport system substrate-binding protein
MIDSRSATPASACIEASSFDTSDYLQRVLDEFTVEDVMWPMPFNVSNPVLYYNRNVFTAAGLDPEDPPATLAELHDAAKAIVDADAARYGMSLEVQAWYIEQWYAKAGEAVVDNDNGRSGRATAATLEKPVGEEIFGWLRSMVDEDLALNVGRNPSGADHLLAIASGDAAMTIGTSAALGGIYDVLESNPDLAQRIGELGVAPLPGSDAGGVVVGGASLWMINRSPDPEKAAVWDFVTWLDEPEQQARWHAGTGYIPIRTSATSLPEVTELWAERPGFEVAFRQLTEGKAPPGGGGPVLGGYPGFREALEEAVERVILEGADAATAVQGAQQKADEAITAYNDRIG